MIISVDFDGTITQSSNPKEEGFNKLRPECRYFMWKMAELGVKFILLTGRRDEWVQEAVDLCKKWKLPIDTTTPTRKQIADYYFDDRNFPKREIDWTDLYLEVKACLM